MKRKFIVLIISIVLITGGIVFSLSEKNENMAGHDYDLISLAPDAFAAEGDEMKITCKCNFWGKCKADGRQDRCTTEIDCNDHNGQCGIF